jgi:hypothetical protein
MFFHGPDFLPLLVPGIITNNPNDAVAFYNLAFIADFSDRHPDLHLRPLIVKYRGYARPV